MCAMLTTCAMPHLLCPSIRLQSLGIAQHFLDLQADRSTSKDRTQYENPPSRRNIPHVVR